MQTYNLYEDWYWYCQKNCNMWYKNLILTKIDIVAFIYSTKHKYNWYNIQLIQHSTDTTYNEYKITKTNKKHDSYTTRVYKKH